MTHMQNNTPRDSAVMLFLQHFGLSLGTDPLTLLRQIVQSFARLPYENLSKIIRAAKSETVTEAIPTPTQIVTEHIWWGTGGTCFSLTATLLHILRVLGWRAEPIFADRPYGPNTHCAMIVWIDGRAHLLDPGYLLTEPILLAPSQATRVVTPFQEVVLVPREDHKLELQTISQGKTTPRLTFKTDPVDAELFERVWHDSFQWEMMRYPVVTTLSRDVHLYLQGNRLQTRSKQLVERRELSPEELAVRIEQTFGISASVAQQALAALARRGERLEGPP